MSVWEDKVKGAYSDGVISEEVCNNLIDWNRQKNELEQEKLKVVSGLNDVFVILASYLVLISGAVLLATVNRAIAPIFTTALSWLLSIHFVMNKKIKSSGFGFLLAFTLSFSTFPLMMINGKWVIPICGVFGVIGALIHYWKFKTSAAYAVAYVGLFIVIVTSINSSGFSEQLRDVLYVGVALPVGILASIHGVRNDLKDIKRKRNESDIAFWLHLVGAPMIVHSIYYLISKNNPNELLIGVTFLSLYAILVFISLTINRRALMVSATGYAIFSFSKALMISSGNFMSGAFASLIIGSVMLLLAIKWELARGIVSQVLPIRWREKLGLIEQLD